ncbi:hypothetical protein RhiirA4_505040 [Rhizophagus irregularis]|uniref:Uncharacterized protein n=1 Tax=Rhizophagus irregularis TaxID=588596 RepID=A0A2I1H9W6_9GLOM|nr:hypothetical protein RhiirA4_505040 [Rhizophagus irregularis]
MAAIRKKLVYAAIQEAFSEADKNPNLNYDLTNQQKLLNGITFADNSLAKDEKAETARIITESYDSFKIIKNEGGRRICENCLYISAYSRSECSSGVYISRTYSFEILDDKENNYVDIINSEDQDELEIPNDK